MPARSSCNVGSPAEFIRSDATYLITGGLGTLGLAVAEWMVERGATSVVLMGRHGMSAAATEPLERIRQAGARATVATGDVCLADDVASALEAIERSMPRLRGVVHAAGITDDDTLVRLSRDRLKSVMAPKVGGAWNLHSLTRDVSLDFFVLFSSGVSLTGSPGQGAHAAADAFLEALAHHRRAQGLPALSINWGGWRGLGMAERPDFKRPFSNRGIGGLTRARAVEALGFLLARPRPQVVVMRVDWRRYVDTRPAMSGITPVESLPRVQVDLASHENTSARRTCPARDRVMSAEPSQRKRAVESILVEHAAGALGLRASRLDAHQPLSRLGFDSLMAIELRNRLEIDLGVAVPVVRFLDGVSLEVIAGELLEQLEQPVLERPDVSASTLFAVSNGAAPHNGEDEDRQIRGIDPEQARELLTKIGELSGTTVDALLDQLMETDGERHRWAAR